MEYLDLCAADAFSEMAKDRIATCTDINLALRQNHFKRNRPCNRRSAKDGAIIHSAAHLENGQRIYFTVANVQQTALNPPTATLTALFTICQNDAFAKTLLHSEASTSEYNSVLQWNANRKSVERRKGGEPVDGQRGLFKKREREKWDKEGECEKKGRGRERGKRKRYWESDDESIKYLPFPLPNTQCIACHDA
ncbi:unnamed protein product [Onchocerca ochengi]|uniref:Reelin domain-containing protein n=1 Tax=Onchocerca ochengi TaxID=42157 RepID=A0A182E3E0_ONCOC|nr:unnamed protein product [Onchocerca ochengi]